MISVKVQDKEFWDNYVKAGEVKGFSIEGAFAQSLDEAMANHDELANYTLTAEEAELLIKEVMMARESYADYPESASNNARKALEWRDKYPNEIKGGTRIGWTRANQLANRRAISEETIARMASFARHRQNAEVDPDKKDKPWTDAGYVAWLIWGGTSGITWASRKLEQIRRQAG
jgi:hypothetical protein